MTQFVLALACPDKPGIVAGVSDFLLTQNMNIMQSHQYGDAESGRFFMRVGFNGLADKPAVEDIRAGFTPIGDKFAMDWQIYDMAVRQRALILVSRFDHCLVDLLYKSRTGALDLDIAAVFSNHDATHDIVTRENIPFYHFPIKDGQKAKSEMQIKKLAKKYQVNLIVLARYMQILSANFVTPFYGKIINIHHSFLPSFKGAVPYSRAFERGVKMIGATAHYITGRLDDGPIIAQDVAAIRHDMDVERMMMVGRQIEQSVLASAVSAHIQHRVLLNGHKTVVFD